MSQPNGPDEWVAQYRRAADQAAQLNDLDEQKTAAKRLHTCYKVLRQTDEGRKAIMVLMSDVSPHVRSWAAAHSLGWAPEAARRVLEALCDENVFPYSFDASMVLQEYDKGRLSFDY